jgi:putative ABC transport system permease protein
MLTHAFWTRRFERDPAVVGKQIDVSGRRITIVGVAPQDFTFPKNADVWIPK